MRRLEALWTLAGRAAARFNRALNGCTTPMKVVRRLISLTPAMLGLYLVLIAATGYLLINHTKVHPCVGSQLPRSPHPVAGRGLARAYDTDRSAGRRYRTRRPGRGSHTHFLRLVRCDGKLYRQRCRSDCCAQAFPERIEAGQTAAKIAAEIRSAWRYRRASILVVPPPPVEGIGNTGGFACGSRTGVVLAPPRWRRPLRNWCGGQ